MKNTKISDIRLIQLPRIEDPRGNLSVIEGNIIPYKIERVYYLYDIPGGAERGGHAHKELQQLLIPLSGSFDVITDDGTNKKKFNLNIASTGLLIVPGIWRELKNFSSGAVCLVIASDVFKEEDYIHDYDVFLESKK